MSLRITQGPGVLSSSQYQQRRFGRQPEVADTPMTPSANVPSLSSMSSSAGTIPQNQTNIKPTSSTGSNPMANIGVPAQGGLSTGGAPTPSLSSMSANNPAPAAAAQTNIAQSGLSAASGDYGDMTKLSDQQLYDIALYGPNAGTPEERAAIKLAAEREQAARYPQPTSAPATNGMDPNTGTQYTQQQLDSAPAPTSQAPANPMQPGVPNDQAGGQQTGGGSNPVTGGGSTPVGGTDGGANPNGQAVGSNGGNPGVYQAPGIPGASNTGVGSNGDGPSNFNPGGGTNPDGINPTVPRGNQNNGTSPANYQLLPQGQESSPYQVTDNLAAQAGNTIAAGTAFDNLNGAQQENLLNVIDQGIKNGTFDWASLRNNPSTRDAYIARFGDPVQNTSGATTNTTNANGTVQGQFDGDQGGAFQAIASNAAAQNDMDIERADAAWAEENNRAITDDELASSRMNDIMSQDGTLMQLAAQDGVDMANRQGLRNSSLAAGSSMAAMARAATPLAQQDAASTNSTELQNQALESDRRKFNADKLQQNNQFNASSENAATSQEFQTEAQRTWQNADMNTRVALSNAQFGNDMMNNDRQRELNYNMQQLAGDQDYAKQGLAAQTAIDVANVEGVYKQFISENDTAARMFDSYYQSVQDVIGNEEFSQSEATGRLATAKRDLEGAMQLILGFESFSLSNPGAGAGGTGQPTDWSNAPDVGTPEWNAFIQEQFPGLSGIGSITP